MRTKDEVFEQLREIVHRHRRRFLRRNLRPCPDNCRSADFTRRGVVGCHGCRSRNPQVCLDERHFVPELTKEELDQQFREDIRDPQIQSRDYRDIMALLWVLGDQEEAPEQVIQEVENHEPEPK